MDDYTPTWRDKVYVRLWYPLRYEMPDNLKRSIANRVPDWLVYFCTIRAYAQAWAKAGDKTPDELTFPEVVKPWGNKWERARIEQEGA